MADKVERKTTAETGVEQSLLDAHYDAVDQANEEGRNDIGRPLRPVKRKAQPQSKATAKAKDKAVSSPKE